MNWLGLDVGGANLKVADGCGFARSISFPLWKQPHQLASALDQLIRDAPHADALALTMTGELADCFETKAEGVHHIFDAVEAAAGSRRVVVYLVDGRFVSLSSARDESRLAAASNWHALARFATRYISKFPAILVDVGSTTTDVVPLDRNGPGTRSRCDTDRLLAGELVYLGVSRTPVAAITNYLPYRGRSCPVAAEFFASTVDSALLLDLIPEDPNDSGTADGRPMTKQFARDRLARTICADRHSFGDHDARIAARFIWNKQIETVAVGLQQVCSTLPSAPAMIAVSGSGAVLAEAACALASPGSAILRLSDSIGVAASAAAPAHAVAVLAAQEQRVR